MKADRLLVISPHPDDEILGCGGTLLRHKAAGGQAFWLNLTDMSTEYGFESSMVDKRTGEIAAVREAVGFDGFHNLALAPTRLDTYPLSELVGMVSEVVTEVKPDTIVLPFHADPHSDHRTAFEAAYACTKPFRHPWVKRVLMAEVISETDHAPSVVGGIFAPNFFIDVTGYMDRKVEILNIYASELGVHPFPRSSAHVRALALHRGSQAGCESAEAFVLLKAVE